MEIPRNISLIGQLAVMAAVSLKTEMTPSSHMFPDRVAIRLHSQVRRGLLLKRSHLRKLLAHLSRRLIGELIVYQWSGVRRRQSVRRRPSSTMLKHLLLRNHLADQSQILCGASLGRGNEILFAASGSHDQDGRHAHIW